MKNIPDKSVDMILCDLPYGITSCKWDSIIPFDKLWEQYERVIKDNGAIVLTASQPFTTKLINSNFNLFKYELIWNKLFGTDIFNAKRKPLKSHENILIFGGKNYNPIMEKSLKKNMRNRVKNFKKGCNDSVYGKQKKYISLKDETLRYPKSIISISNQSKECHKSKRVHPTQKPVALFEYLVKTYTNEGDLVLDNCAGSGTTGVACINTKRNFILMEKEEKYCEIMKKRLSKSD